jgi:hypothetical protein
MLGARIPGMSFVRPGLWDNRKVNWNSTEIGKLYPPSLSLTTILTKEKQLKFLFYKSSFFFVIGVEEMKCTLDAFQLPVFNKKSFSLKELE